MPARSILHTVGPGIDSLAVVGHKPILDIVGPTIARVPSAREQVGLRQFQMSLLIIRDCSHQGSSNEFRPYKVG